MASLDKILQPNVLSRLVSRKMVAEQWILGAFGFEVGGRNEVFLGHGREGNYDVFNNTRTAGSGRQPGTKAAVVEAQKVGNVKFDYPRMHEKINLSAEKLHNLRRIGDNGARDIAGARYIDKQTDYIAQRGANWRLALTAGMLRDSLYLIPDGDDLYVDLTTGTGATNIPFQMPAGNKTQLDMLGAGNIITASWLTASTDIPLHIGNIDAAFQELYGGNLKNVICTNKVWQAILKNDHVTAQAGVSTTPFEMFDRVVGTRADGSPLNVQVGRLACRPFVDWWITDAGIELGPDNGTKTYRKFCEENNAIFLPDFDQGNFLMQLGSEPIAEYHGGPESVRVGQYLWSNKDYDPTATNIFCLDNALAVNDIPNSVAYGTVIF